MSLASHDKKKKKWLRQKYKRDLSKKMKVPKKYGCNVIVKKDERR
jgi:hypothetical protein